MSRKAHNNRIPDVVGFQAEEHLAEGEGYLNGDSDECSVPVSLKMLLSSNFWGICGVFLRLIWN